MGVVSIIRLNVGLAYIKERMDTCVVNQNLFIMKQIKKKLYGDDMND